MIVEHTKRTALKKKLNEEKENLLQCHLITTSDELKGRSYVTNLPVAL